MAGEGFFPFSSETSLGWTRSATSTISQSYGTTLLSGLSVTGTNLATQFLGPDGNGTFPLYGFSAETRLGLWRSANSTIECTFGSFAVNTGLATRPGLAIASEKSLGFYRSAASTLALSYGALAHPAGTAVQPSIVFSSESSLGCYRSGTSTMALSYGTLDLTGGGAVTSIASLTVKSGTNNSCGTAVLGSNGSVNVANTYVKTGDLIFLTDQTPGGTIGDLELGGIRNSSGFTIQSTSVTDTSTVAWLIVRPS